MIQQEFVPIREYTYIEGVDEHIYDGIFDHHKFVMSVNKTDYMKIDFSIPAPPDNICTDIIHYIAAFEIDRWSSAI